MSDCAGEEVRERSPLHELGEREWPPQEGERDKFRVRVRRQQSSRGPLVGRHPVRSAGVNLAHQHSRQHQPSANPSISQNSSVVRHNRYGEYANVNNNNPTTSPMLASPELCRKPSVGNNGAEKSPTFTRTRNTNYGGGGGGGGNSSAAASNVAAGQPQRPSRLPVVAMYNPKLSMTSLDIKQIRPQMILPTKRLLPAEPMSPKTERHGSMSPGSSNSTCSTTTTRRNGNISSSSAAVGSSSPQRVARRGATSPKRGDISRRVPSPTLTTSRRRSPSLNRSRPPSPGGRGSRPPSPRNGGTPIRRNPSPSQLDPEQADALRKRLGKARRVKLYLLQQSGSNSFLVAGDSPQQKYKVNIGPQTCSCGKGPGCLHLLFIMLRVFKIPENDSRLTARELKEFEIEALFRSHEERKKIRVLRSRQQSMEQLMEQDTTDQEAEMEDGEDALCPICLNELMNRGDEAEALTMCSSCNNSLHHHCMSIWVDECQNQGETVFCPLCRSLWAPQAANGSRPAPVVQQNNAYQYFAPSPYTNPVVANASKSRAGGFSHVQNSVSASTSSGYSTVSRTSDTLHMIEQGGCPEDIPLPKAEPIPQQHWPFASNWITYFGRDLVACLFSRDWVKRETGLRRLAREIVQILKTNAGSNEYSERVERSWKCSADMLAMMIEDKVYKVFLAAVKTLRALLNFLNCHDEAQLGQIKAQVRPLIQSILIKCADGNKRMSEISTDTLLELCRGQEGGMALGKHASCKYPGGLGGIDYLLFIILEDRDLHSVSWQWIMGRLLVLNKIILEIPLEFSLENKNANINFNRLMMIIDFSFQNLNSSHTNVSRLARKVFTLAARNTAADSTTFNQVWELLGALDPTLQIRMRKNLTSAIEELYLGESNTMGGSNSSSSMEEKSRTPQEQDRTAFLEKFLNECSNQHTEFNLYNQSFSSAPKRRGWRPPLIRSTSHSPSRQIKSSSRSNSQSPSRAFCKPQLKNSMCQSVYNVSQFSHAAKTRPNCLPLNNKPRVLTRLGQKSKIHELAREVLPKFDLSFLNNSNGEDMDAYEEDAPAEVVMKPVVKSKSMTRVGVPTTSSRNSSPTKVPHKDLHGGCHKSPPPQVKRGSRDSGVSRVTPLSSPLLMQRDKRSGSCKDLVDYEESLALAKALSKSIYHETPLPVIPGLSQPKVHSHDDVLAHPHRDIMEEGEWKREYKEGVDWTKGTKLGTGAYSTCYQARDVETGTLMAAKQISFCRNSDEEQDKVEQLIREEVLLLSKLQHPQVVRMYGAIQEGSHINVFEEWMPGGSISSLLDRHGPFTESVILRYTHQILLGLDYLHTNGVLHRDLKGANLLVDTSGHYMRIADFGAAARMMSKSTVPGEFQGQIQGTIAFMAPEVMRGDSYGRSCDIWSVGCCIIEMATAKPPWGASDVSNHLALIFRIACAGEPPEVPAHLSPALRDLTLRCLDLDPLMRPSARDLLLHPSLQEE